SATFPIVDTANLIGMIEGRSNKGNTLIISATLDGLGTGLEDSYFPGAANSASGVGILMETARIMKLSESLPYETVLFVLWNGSNQSYGGVTYYMEHPIHSLGKTTVIHLDQIGNPSTEGLVLAPDPLNGGLIVDLMLKHAKDYGVVVSKQASRNAISYLFLNEKVPSIVLGDSMSIQNNYADTVEVVDRKTIEDASKVLLSYVKRVVYRDVKIDYLSFAQKTSLVFIAFLGALTFAVGVIYNANTSTKFGRFELEALYFSTPFMFLRKFFTSVLPYIFVVFMLAVLVNIDPNADMTRRNGQTITNVSLFLIFKNSFYYLRDLFTTDLFNSHTMKELFRVLADSSRLSILLVSMALLISAVFGILSGMIEAYRSKKTSLGSLASLIFFSIPDVLIVLVLSLGYTKFLVLFPKLNGLLPMKEFVLPLVALSIVPTVYITRITFITIQEEMTKDYIKNEKAKGFSRKKIIFVELLPAILFKIVDTMPAIMTMLLSNMIIIEYLFNYKGILYFLVYLYNRQDVFRFVPLALVLGMIYILYTGGFKLLSKVINPLKRKGEIE
ncbi:MAG: ABC transporter permease subunit, partial [Vallitaleaceae bacterium]|nr:ABC transporter permease subunit [Vallitaleaceae bacterium]